MDASLSYATTPLALASLVIIAGVGVLKLLVAGKNNTLNKIITHYGFIIVIVFGLLGNVAYLYGLYQSSEIMILGNVIDGESGQYLPNVLIDTGGHARGMSSDTGDFVLAIPASRVNEVYEVTASVPGYERKTVTIKSKSRMFVRFELTKKKFLVGDVFKLADSEIVVGHYMGLPELYVPLLIENPGTSVVNASNFSLELTAPSGKVRQLILANSAPSMNSALGSALPQIQVKQGERFSWMNLYLQYDNQIQLLSAQAIQALQAIPEFRQTGPKVGRQYISSILSEKIRQAMLANWFWESGETVIKVTCSVNGVQYKLVRRISLSNDQILAMKKSSDYYINGYGVVFGFELVPVGSAQPGQKLTARAE